MYSFYFSDPEFLRQSEKYWFYGIVLSCMSYGLNFTLSLSCIRLLFPQLQPYSKKHSPSTVVDSSSQQRNLYSFGFTLLLFGFATASIIPVIVVGKGAFSSIGNSSSGPAQYLVEHVFQIVTTLRVAYVVSILCHVCSAIRLIRSYLTIQKHATGRFCRGGVLWHGMMMSLPIALFVASIASGTIFVAQIVAPSKIPQRLASKDWVLIWGAIATALSWELTSVITIRLAIFRGSLLRSLAKDLQINYTGIITMLLESTTLLSSFSIFFMIAYSVKSPSLVMVPFLLPQVQVTSPLLVLYRVTSNRTSSNDVTFKFVEPSMPTFARNSSVSEDSSTAL